MGIFIVQAVNTLNEKGLRYKAIEREGQPVFQFGIVVPDAQKGKVAKEIVEISPKAEGIAISLMGKEKPMDGKGFEEFVDGVLKLKALQEEELKLISELSA
ncbi:hypothetical protein ACFVS2_20290 [Brevibacillus sp. NPDC058079]|uniref:hypothetical protein n=1 Tax=Brevibacillus sp. NPDC058079 TaxID=3346330 RepID=UPI0036E2EF6A